MAILLCKVPLNIDTHRERGREKEATAAVELSLAHITHTKSICAEVAPVAFWVVSASPKFNTTRCSCPHHQLVEVTLALAVGPLAWAMPAEVVCMMWRCSLSTCCCCKTAAVLWPLVCSIRKAFDQVICYESLERVIGINHKYWNHGKIKRHYPFRRPKWRNPYQKGFEHARPPP